MELLELLPFLCRPTSWQRTKALNVNDSSDEDRQLVQAALDGQQQAYGELVSRYQDRLFNALLRVLGSRDDARDVVQDALIQAFVKLESFRGDARFYTWLYRIAMNLALSHRRRRRPVVSVEEAKDNVGVEPADPQQRPDQDLMQQERAAIVQQALDQLNTEHRQILVLREMEGCSYDNIAEILNLPVGTVRSRLFRARMQLKEQLEILLPGES